MITAAEADFAAQDAQIVAARASSDALDALIKIDFSDTAAAQAANVANDEATAQVTRTRTARDETLTNYRSAADEADTSCAKLKLAKVSVDADYVSALIVSGPESAAAADEAVVASKAKWTAAKG